MGRVFTQPQELANFPGRTAFGPQHDQEPILLPRRAGLEQLFETGPKLGGRFREGRLGPGVPAGRTLSPTLFSSRFRPNDVPSLALDLFAAIPAESPYHEEKKRGKLRACGVPAGKPSPPLSQELEYDFVVKVLPILGGQREQPDYVTNQAPVPLQQQNQPLGRLIPQQIDERPDFSLPGEARVLSHVHRPVSSPFVSFTERLMPKLIGARPSNRT